MRFFILLFAIFAFPGGAAFAQYAQRPSQATEECPQGRQIRAQKAYPSTMSDCEVLDVDTLAENQRLQGRAILAPHPTNRPPRASARSSTSPTQSDAMPNAGIKAADYAAIASLPCAKYLSAYGTSQLATLSEPLIEAISARDGGLGSGANIIDFVATECRLNEMMTIGQAVESLLDKQRQNRLPRIPFGGATSAPEVHASWDAFDKWIHHRGPRPDLNNASPPVPDDRATVLAQTKSATSIDCHKDGDEITVKGVASAQSLELANGSMKNVWLLATDKPICVVESEDGNAALQEHRVSRLQIVGKPPPTGVAIELKGKLSTGNITQYYAESTAVVVTSGGQSPTGQERPAKLPAYTQAAEARSLPFGGLRWKDGYVDGGRFIEADWRTIEADNGAVTAIDMKSVVRNDLNHSAYVVAYVVEGDFFDPNNLRGFRFDCQGHFTVLSGTGISSLAYAPPRSVAAQIAALACATAP